MIPKGLQYVAWSAFYFSLATLLAKFAIVRMSAIDLVLVRSAVGFTIAVWMIRQAKISFWGFRKKLLILRGVLGTLALICFFWSLNFLPMAEATVLFYLSPAFGSVLVAIFLREPLRLLEIAGLGANLLGVVLVAQPGFIFGDAAEGHNLIAIGVGILGAILAGGAFTVVRELRRTESPLTVVLYFPMVSIIMCAPLLLIGDSSTPTTMDWLVMLGMGISFQIAQLYLTKGLHLEKTTRAMSVSYLQILLAVILGVLFLSEKPNLLSLVGVVMIVGGTLIVTHNSDNKRRKFRHPDHQQPQRSPL